MDMNRCILTGRLTRDCELSQTNGGTDVARLRLAFNTGRRVEGEWREVANFVDVVMYGSRVNRLSTYLTKGRKIGVDGRLQWREYEDSTGVERQVHEIVADNLHFMDRGSNGDTKVAAAVASKSDSQGGDDDIPF